HRVTDALLLLLFLGRLLLRHSSVTSFPVTLGSRAARESRSVPHRFAPEVSRLFAAPALVMVEVGIQLRQRDHRYATFFHRRVEHALVVGRQQIDIAFALARPESQ